MLMAAVGCNQVRGQKLFDYDTLALHYLISNQEAIDPRLSGLDILIPTGQLKVESSAWLTDVYICTKDTSLRIDADKELKGSSIRLPYVNSINTKGIRNKGKGSIKRSDKRTIQIFGQLHHNNKIYVEIKLLSLNNMFGESIIFQFERGKKDVLRTCVNTWVL